MSQVYWHLQWMSTTTHPLSLSWKLTPFLQHLEPKLVFVYAKGLGYGWLIGRIAHTIFISTLHFHLDFIQPLTFSLFTCECGHMLDIFNTHLIHCSFGGQGIMTHDTIWNVMYALAKKKACCMERVVIRPYVKSFITSWYLHDPRGLGLCCWCGDY